MISHGLVEPFCQRPKTWPCAGLRGHLWCNNCIVTHGTRAAEASCTTPGDRSILTPVAGLDNSSLWRKLFLLPVLMWKPGTHVVCSVDTCSGRGSDSSTNLALPSNQYIRRNGGSRKQARAWRNCVITIVTHKVYLVKALLQHIISSHQVEVCYTCRSS